MTVRVRRAAAPTVTVREDALAGEQVRTSPPARVGPPGPVGPVGPAGIPGWVEQTWTHQGAVALSSVGRSRWSPGVAGNLVQLQLWADTPSTSGPVVVAVLRNHVEVARLTLLAGQDRITATPSVALLAGDFLTVDVLAVGTAAADLTLTARVHPTDTP